MDSYVKSRSSYRGPTSSDFTRAAVAQAEIEGKKTASAIAGYPRNIVELVNSTTSARIYEAFQQLTTQGYLICLTEDIGKEQDVGKVSECF